MSAAIIGTLAFILVVNGWVVIDVAQEPDEEMRLGALVFAVFFDLVMLPIAVFFGASWWSSRAGSMVCSPEGLAYVHFYRRKLLPWSTMLGVQVANSSIQPLGGSVVDRYLTRVLVTYGGPPRWRLVGSGWCSDEPRVAVQAGTIEAWRVHFAAPAAAWYPSPEGRGQRYWDGAAWTEHVAD